jgi:DnaJ domain
MIGFFAKLLGTRSAPTPGAIQPREQSSRQGSGRREPPRDIDWSQAEYIPLPPSPPTWEVDGRDEFNRDYKDPALGPVIRAGWAGQHTKVVKLAGALSPEQRQGTLGPVIAQAYRKVIVQRMKAGQLVAAAAQCQEMFECIPGSVEDVDKRRFNRILAEMDKAGKGHGLTPMEVAEANDEPLFAVSAGSGWSLEGERKLSATEKPDASFDVIAAGVGGTWLLRRAKGADCKTVLRRMSRSGKIEAERALDHDVYRTGGAAGRCFAIMDSAGGLHVYDASLNPVIERNLREDRRVAGHFRTIETNYWGEFKSQVRAVDVSPEGDRYLFTLADEAWCCALSGESAWGVAMPLREGWMRVVARSERFGASREVEEALQLFGLSFPVSPAEIQQRYRTLALARHPDRNPDRPQASEEMKALNLAFEVLTGVDPNTIELDGGDRVSFARTAPDQVIDVGPFRIEMTISDGVPQDWVYAARFAGSDGGAFVATYSGKVILLSRDGRALAVYDLGTCPHDIIDAGPYTYLLTATRLYVIKYRNKLMALVDVFQQGRFFVGETGLGLITSKKLQWLTLDGTKVGEVETRDPIRELYAADGATILKTRQHQVTVRGLRL